MRGGSRVRSSAHAGVHSSLVDEVGNIIQMVDLLDQYYIKLTSLGARSEQATFRELGVGGNAASRTQGGRQQGPRCECISCVVYRIIVSCMHSITSSQLHVHAMQYMSQAVEAHLVGLLTSMSRAARQRSDPAR